MSTNSKKEILEMLESGKIDAEEAARLLSETSTEPVVEATPVPEMAPEVEKEVATPISIGAKETRDGPSMFHVRVRDLKTGKNKVTVNIPVRLLKFGLKLGGRFSPELEGLDLGELNEMMAEMSEMEQGILVEVQDEEDNEHVQVYFD